MEGRRGGGTNNEILARGFLRIYIPMIYLRKPLEKGRRGDGRKDDRANARVWISGWPSRRNKRERMSGRDFENEERFAAASPRTSGQILRSYWSCSFILRCHRERKMERRIYVLEKRERERKVEGGERERQDRKPGLYCQKVYLSDENARRSADVVAKEPQRVAECTRC